MRIAVYGTGGVGGYFGGRLASAGYDVSFIARGAHLDALRTRGLRVSSVLGDFHLQSVHASDAPADIGKVDFILLGVKSWQVESVCNALQPLLGDATAVVTLQNGVDAPEVVGKTIGRERVLPGLVKLFTRISAPGCIEHIGGPGLIQFGEWDGATSARVQRLHDALARAGVAVEVSDHIQAALWAKLLFVAPMGGLGAVSRAPIGVLRSMRETRDLLRACMMEIAATARAEDVSLPQDVIERTLNFIDCQPAAGTSSLQRDIAAGKRSELDAWLGTIVRRAMRSDTPVPLCSYLYHSLLPLERRARGEVAFAG